MDSYAWVKALHIAAAMMWIGGMLVGGLAIASLPARGKAQAEAGPPPLLTILGRWDRCVTSPAMLLAWGFGLTMAMQGGWLASPWLMIKLAMVVLLSALHGMLSGALHRSVRVTGRDLSALLRHAPPVTAAGAAIVAILAVTKPF